MRRLLSALVILCAAGSLSATQPRQSATVYRSVEDPPGQQPRQIILDDNTFKFGQAGDDVKSLLRSDLGFSLHFLKVNGGVRVRGQPILFPSGSQTQFDFEDFSCGVLNTTSITEVLCTSRTGGQLYRSQIVNGGLVSFELRCLEENERKCRYELKSGRPLRPSKIQAE